MTNKPMLSVERQLLEVIAEFISSQADAFPIISVPRGLRSDGLDQVSKELRAILDKPDTPYTPKGVWSFDHIDGGDIVIRNGKDWTLIKRGDGPIYEQFLYRFCEEQMKTADQHHGTPVAWAECSPAWLKAGGDCATAPRLCVGRGGISHLHPAHAEHPAPVASESACTSCDGSGEYTDATGDWRGYCTCPAGVEAEGIKGLMP